jgi:hypothetical protein
VEADITRPNYLDESGLLIEDLSDDNSINEDNTLNKGINKTIDKSLNSSINSSLPDMLEGSELKLSKLPEQRINLDDVKLVKFSSDLVTNLDLNLKIGHILGISSLVKFDETISYSEKQGTRFKHFVVKKHGYLINEDNYIKVNEKYMSSNSKATTLRNLRVVLFWRGFDLDDISCKRIITLGLVYLLENMSKTELQVAIRKVIPAGIFEVSVERKLKTWVLIGVEVPIFRP